MGEIEKEKDMRLIDADLLEKEFIKDTPQACGTVGIKYIDDLIKKQPTANEWIPCSERLPDEAFPCLVTVIDTEPMAMEDFNNILPYFVGYDGETWNDEDGEVIPFEVIAWQPLPSVWKGENNAEK